MSPTSRTTGAQGDRGPNEQLVGIASPAWGVIGASVAGALARDGAKSMQDACAAAVGGAGELFLAVADGASSAPMGGTGARVAVAAGIEALADVVRFRQRTRGVPVSCAAEWRDDAHVIMRCVRSYVLRAARQHRARRDDLACTLTLVYANAFVVLVTQVGDGRCAVLWDDGTWEGVTLPQRGEFAGETQFLTSRGWRHDAALLESRMLLGRADAVALLTDGCERVAFECQSFDPSTGVYAHTNTPHAPFLTPNVRTLQRLLQRGDAGAPMAAARIWGAFLRDGTPELPALRDEPDDKTLLLAVRREAAPDETPSSAVPHATDTDTGASPLATDS